MIQVSLDEQELKNLYLEEVQKRLDQIELETMLMDSKVLCRVLNISWPTIEKLFLYDPNFPSMRIGKKWMFNRREVQGFIDRWSNDMRKRGGVVSLDQLIKALYRLMIVNDELTLYWSTAATTKNQH